MLRRWVFSIEWAGVAYMGESDIADSRGMYNYSGRQRVVWGWLGHQLLETVY